MIKYQKKYFETIYIDYQNPTQLKVRRKGKTVLVDLPKKEIIRQTFRDILFSMTNSTNSINSKDFEKVETNVKNRPFIYLLDDNEEIIFNNIKTFMLNIFPEDKKIKSIVNTDEFKKYAIGQYNKNKL